MSSLSDLSDFLEYPLNTGVVALLQYEYGDAETGEIYGELDQGVS
jgi:hypothetical protein